MSEPDRIPPLLDDPTIDGAMNEAEMEAAGFESIWPTGVRRAQVKHFAWRYTHAAAKEAGAHVEIHGEPGRIRLAIWINSLESGSDYPRASIPVFARLRDAVKYAEDARNRGWRAE